jgi:putative tryptophan/tyrosine transport system substrate-binding protein
MAIKIGNLEMFVRLILSVLLCLPGMSAEGANNLRVLVVLSESITPYQNFAKTFRQNLNANIQISELERAESFTEHEQPADLIVTVGVKAAEWVATRTATPILAAMIPSYKYAELLAKQPRAKQISAIYIDQSWARQIDLLLAALPNQKMIGVLYSADTRLDLRALREELASRGYTLIAKQLHSQDTLFADLEDLLDHSDVLLAIPDSTIYSKNNIRNILLTSYQYGKPLVGLSQAYVDAGALCAIFSTPEQLAAQASAATSAFAQSRLLPAPQSPALFTILVNQEVARTLKVSTKSAESLYLQVEKAQGGRR